MSSRTPIAGPYAILIVPERDFMLIRSGTLPVVVPDPDGTLAAAWRENRPDAAEGRPALRTVALATLEAQKKHGQLAATLWAMSSEDRTHVARRLRELAAYLESGGETSPPHIP